MLQIEKLFDIAFILTDVLTVIPIETATFEVGPRDYLSHILQLLSGLWGGETRYVKLLHTKIHESLPAMAASLALPTPPSSTSNHSLKRFSPNLTDGSGGGSTSTGPSSPYSSPPGIAGFPQLIPAPNRFQNLNNVSSAPDGTKIGLTMGLGSQSMMPPSPNSGTPTGPLSGTPSDLSDPYPMHFATEPGFPS